MATIRLCDWTKKRLASNEETFTLTLNGKTYEVSLSALEEIQSRLEGDEAPVARQVPPRPARIAPAQPPVQQTGADVGINVEAPSPFGGKAEAGLLDDTPAPTPQAQPPVAPIAIPASTKERLPVPTPAQAEAVVAESVRFPAGTLSALNPGRQRNVAAKKLAEREAVVESKFKSEKERLQ